jgi:flagella basal body P-ring formation protein FlgA
METRRPFIVRTGLAAAALVVAGVVCAVSLEGQAGPPGLAPADALIRAAIVARLGVDATITIDAIDMPLRPGVPTLFRQARPDPSARLGHAMRFSLVPASGMPITAVVTMHVVAEHVVTARAIDRNETMTPDAMAVVRAELRDVPLRKILTPVEVRDGRVLRPMPAGAVVLPGSVVVRRAVEPGDRVTVVAASGDVEVSAEFVAADGGDPGDVIRVVNPDTRKGIRGRIVKQGWVEVNYAR